MDQLESSGSRCHDCTLKDEVISHKESVITEKEKYLKNESKIRLDLKKNIQKMKQNYDKVIEENNKMSSMIQENKELIKSLKEELGVKDAEADVQEVSRSTLFGKTPNTKTSGNFCVTCELRFLSNKALEQHFQDVHTELICMICEKSFRNKRDLDSHSEECIDYGMATVECNKCEKKFARWGSKRHKCQPQKEFNCTICGAVGRSINDMKKHINEVHGRQQEKSKEVCRHYRNGNCLKGQSCKFSHVGFVRNNSQQTSSQVNIPKTTTCRHENNCSWLARGLCSFFHPGIGVQKPRQQGNQQIPALNPNSMRSQETRQVQQSQNRAGRPQCWFAERCNRGPSCSYDHQSLEGFQLVERKQQRTQQRGQTSQRIFN